MAEISHTAVIIGGRNDGNSLAVTETETQSGLAERTYPIVPGAYEPETVTFRLVWRLYAPALAQGQQRWCALHPNAEKAYREDA